MRKLFLTLLGLLSFAAIACGPPVTPPAPDAGDACGGLCGLPYGNTCIDGQCFCVSDDGNASTGAPCSTTARCVPELGRCIVPDGDGASCDVVDHRLCPDADQVCVQGYCTVPDCGHLEICNGLDDDCDGLVDQTPPNDPLERDCYTGPSGSENVGICVGGTQKCIGGGWQTSCYGEQLPIPETGLLACDLIDNDCNNCVDDQIDENGQQTCGAPQKRTTDFNFMIDVSGSMSGVHAAVVTAAGDFAAPYAPETHLHWAIERIAAVEPVLVDVFQPFTDFTTFLAKLGTLTTIGGIEPTYDAVWLTATHAFDGDLYNQGAVTPGVLQIYVVFGDETAQTLLNLNEADVCQAVADRGAILVVFTTPSFFPQWDDCAILYPLTTDAAEMTNDLNDLFSMTCSF